MEIAVDDRRMGDRPRARDRRRVAAKSAAVTVLLLLALAWSGGLAGWISAWHAASGRRALERTLSEAGTRADVERALTEAGLALDANPLSRDSRLLYQRAAEEAVDRLGAARVASLAPKATLSRALLADVLERHRAAVVATGVRVGIETTRREEIEVIGDEVLRQVALDAAVAERCRQALPLLEYASARAPDDAGLALGYASCLNKRGEGSRSLPILARIYQRDPTSKWVHFLLAEAFLNVGRLSQADETTRWLTVRSPNFYLGWRLRGDVLAAIGRPGDALESYRVALALAPRSAWLKWRIGEMERSSQTSAPIDSTGADHRGALPSRG
jgi:predicted Zn-dependent protease